MTTLDTIRKSAQSFANDTGLCFAIVSLPEGYDWMVYESAMEFDIIEVIKPEKRV